MALSEGASEVTFMKKLMLMASLLSSNANLPLLALPLHTLCSAFAVVGMLVQFSFP